MTDPHAAESAHDDHGHEVHEHEGHGGSIKTYLFVFIALCVLTTGSFMTYFDFWDKNFSPQAAWAFMMAISCTKATLVILFFMHLKYEANWKYVLTIPASFMSVFLVCMLIPDVGLRMNNGSYRYSEHRWNYAATPPEDEPPHAAKPKSGEEH